MDIGLGLQKGNTMITLNIKYRASGNHQVLENIRLRQRLQSVKLNVPEQILSCRRSETFKIAVLFLSFKSTTRCKRTVGYCFIFKRKASHIIGYFFVQTERLSPGKPLMLLYRLVPISPSINGQLHTSHLHTLVLILSSLAMV